MNVIDESKLSEIDRLGLAWCRLNSGEWDEILGPKPDGYDELPLIPPPRWQFWKRNRLSKLDIIIRRMRNIESIIGNANVSRCWWIFGLERTEAEWRNWYINER